MKDVYKQKRQQGFTIIEVLIVLAIAALILLIVFLAVPALQRNARNNSRNNDAARVTAAVNNYLSNRNGTFPAGTTDLNTILSDVGTLGQYGTLTSAGDNATNCAATSLTNAKLTECVGVAIAETPLSNTQDGMVLAIKAQCDTATQGGMIVGSSRQAAILYSVESGSANGLVKCLNV